MSNLSLTQTPSGGWDFYQPQTNWRMPTPIAQTFGQAVVLIIRHRMANPAVGVKAAWKTDKTSVEAELIMFTRLRLGLPDASSAVVAGSGAPAPTRGGCCGG